LGAGLRKSCRNLLPKCVSTGYTRQMKDSGLRIRVERALRERFLEICRQQDRPAAQVLREFMRTYIAEREAMDTNEAKKRVKP